MQGTNLIRILQENKTESNNSSRAAHCWAAEAMATTGDKALLLLLPRQGGAAVVGAPNNAPLEGRTAAAAMRDMAATFSLRPGF